MESITFTLETITPLFIAGADDKTSELRPPSIKGMMRFWWRAYKYPQLLNPSQEEKIKELSKLEGKIFGSSKEGGGKSSFSLRILCDVPISSNLNKFPKHNIQVTTSKGKSFHINILEYMAYGTYEYKKGQLNPGTRVTILLNILDNKYKDEILKSLYFWSAFGSLGARARNGFGNFSVVNRTIFREIGEDFVSNIVPISNMLTSYFIGNDVPPFSAFSRNARLFRARVTHRDWHSCLAS
jgi:CRISPR-associated protein Cmr1